MTGVLRQFVIGLILGAGSIAFLPKASLEYFVSKLPGTPAQLLFGTAMILIGFLYLIKGHEHTKLRRALSVALSIYNQLCWLSGFLLGVGLASLDVWYFLHMAWLAACLGVPCIVLRGQLSVAINSRIVATALLVAGLINIILPFAMHK